MRSDAIQVLQREIPEAFQVRDVSWPEPTVVVHPDHPSRDDLEDEIFGGDPIADPDPLAGIPEEALPSEGVAEDLGGPTDEVDYGSAEEQAIVIGSSVGDGWPGAPAGGTRPRPAPPPTDVLAFYLPWHRFKPDVWGIYLIVEGIEALGADIHSRAKRFLSRSEARRAARFFLFLHEQYHNAAESFAARVETSHRRPCYLTGVQGQYASPSATCGVPVHEETLANAYAWLGIQKDAFRDANWLTARRRRLKRIAAAAALRQIVSQMPGYYGAARTIIAAPWGFDDQEACWQESCHNQANPKVRFTAPSIWKAAGYAMMPTIDRNGRYSYTIAKSHLAVRQPVQVPRFHHRDVLRRLLNCTGGKLQSGGKHPKLVLPSGKRIPVPNHPGDMPVGTIRKILADAGLDISVRHFLSATDSELERAFAARRTGQPR